MHPSTVKLIILYVVVSVTGASAWRSTLYPKTWTPETSASFYNDKIIQDFSWAGYHRGEAPIPTSQAPLFDVTKAPYNADETGKKDATAAIQSAINAAGSAGGGVVFLPAGTYLINADTKSEALLINKSKVVLRGDGYAKTFITNTTTNMRSKAIIRFSSGASWSSVPSGSPVGKFLSDVTGPTQTIKVSNAASFKAGEWIIIHSDITDAWITEHKEPLWTGFGNNLPGFYYLRQITTVNGAGNQITFDIPLRYTLKVRDNAQVYRAPAHLEEVGIENLSLGNRQNNTAGWADADYTVSGTGAYQVHDSYGIIFRGVRNGWLRNIHTYSPQNASSANLLSNGILLDQSRSITVDACVIQNLQYGGGGGNGYAYRFAAQEILVSHCIAQLERHGFVFSQMYASGNVLYDCLDKDGGKQTSGTQVAGGKGSDHHMHFSHSNLMDNCRANNSVYQASYRPFGSAPKHNLTAAHSVYWNTKGEGAASSYLVQTQQSRYGYVIGTSGTFSSVSTTTGANTEKTEPVDHVEGVGQGGSLEPSSLYLDQLARRLGNTGIKVDPDIGRQILATPILNIALQGRVAFLGFDSGKDLDLEVVTLSGQKVFNTSTAIKPGIPIAVELPAHSGIYLARYRIDGRNGSVSIVLP